MPEEFEKAAIRYLDKSMSPEERSSFQEKILKDKELRKQFYHLKDIWDSANKTDMPDIESELKRLKNRIGTKSEPVISKQTRYLQVFIRAAAILVFGIMIGKFADSPRRDYNAFNTLSVPKGSRSTLLLSDGTNIILNSGSSITYPVVFNEKAREVSLSGEAYFNVTEDKKHPFIVSTGDYKVKVLGTEFNVSSYKDFNKVTTSLIKGKVQIITPENRETILEPGQKIIYLRDNKKFLVEDADLENETSWKDNIFSFKDEPVELLFKRLEMWYDIKILFRGDTIKDATFTGKFRNHETIWQALDAIKTTSDIEYEHTGFREFTLFYKN